MGGVVVPLVSESYKRDRIRVLYRATWKHIAEHGLQHVTLDEVLRAAGLTSGALYNYFGSRNELVEAAIEAALAELRIVLERAVAELTNSPPALFVAVVSSFAEAAQEEPFAMATASLVTNSRPPLQEPDPAILERYEGFVARVNEHACHWADIGALPAGVDPRAFAQFFISTMLGYFIQQPLAGNDGPHSHLRILEQLTLNTSATT